MITHQGEVMEFRSSPKPQQLRTAPGAFHAEKSRIALVDQEHELHAELRHAIDKLSGWALESYFSADDAIERITIKPPRAVLIEIRSDLSTFSGIAFTRRLKAVLPELPIVVLTCVSDDDCVLLSLMAGACGYLVKPCSTEDTVNYTLAAIGGATPLCTRAKKALVRCLNRAGAYVEVSRLSFREQQILPCLLQRLSDKEIAEILGISPGTVHVHVSSIFRRLEVHSREEVIRKFLGLTSETPFKQTFS